MTWEEVCAIGSALPLVETGSYHGYPALRVAVKFLTRLGDTTTVRVQSVDPDGRSEFGRPDGVSLARVSGLQYLRASAYDR
jgi:hypothetical protein